MQIDFINVLSQNKALVWKEIETYLKAPLELSGKRAIPDRYQDEIASHWEMVKDYPLRQGKYLRPTLLLLTTQAMGFPSEKAIKTAAAMQTSEDWILNHDDLEDDSKERRGKPCLHRIYGPELAVNAGDALHVIMWKMLWDNCDLVGEKKAQEIAGEFYQMLSRTVLGQTVEIKWTQEKKADLTDNDIFFILDGKTVYYSIAGPMRLGAILAGATEEQLEAIYEFSQPLGRCFQTVDDLLDLTSDFKGLKKQKGNDLYEGKRTLILLHLFRNINKEDLPKLEGIMDKAREEKTPEEIDWILEKMKEYGSLDYARELAQKLAKEAEEIFENKLGFLSYQPARDQLKAGINFILKREY